MQSTSNVPSNEGLPNEEIINQTGRDAYQLQKQIISLGKQSKAAPGRKKRDMVNFFYMFY